MVSDQPPEPRFFVLEAACGGLTTPSSTQWGLRTLGKPRVAHNVAIPSA